MLQAISQAEQAKAEPCNPAPDAEELEKRGRLGPQLWQPPEPSNDKPAGQPTRRLSYHPATYHLTILPMTWQDA